jgi:hypothetical protein
MYFINPTIEGYTIDGDVVCIGCVESGRYNDGKIPECAYPIWSSETHGDCTPSLGCLNRCGICGEPLGAVECYPVPEYA